MHACAYMLESRGPSIVGLASLATDTGTWIRRDSQTCSMSDMSNNKTVNL